MFSKKKDEKIDNAFDIDGDLDFPGFDIDAPDTKDNRHPVTKFSSGFLEGVTQSMQDLHKIKDVTKDVLPAGFGQTIDLAGTVSQNIGKTYEQVSKSIKPVVKDTKRVITKIIPQDSSLVPESVKEILKKWKEEEADSIRPDLSAERQREDFLTSQIAEAFKFNVEQDAQNRIEDKAKAALIEGTEQVRFNASFGVLNNIAKDTSRMVQYETGVTLSYQKKSLELQFRSLFALQDILIEGKALRALSDKGFQDVVKNTALPEFKKIHKSEAFMELARNKFFGNIQSGLFGDNSRYIQDLFSNIGRAITDKVSSMASDFRMGLSAVESGVEQVSSMVGENGMVDGIDLAGQVVGGELGGTAMRRAGKWVKKNFITGNERIDRMNDWLMDFNENKAQRLQDFRNTDEYLFQDGLKASLMRWLQGVLPGNSVDTRMEMLGSKDMNSAFIYTRRTDRTINEIIPGYLARQLQVQQMILTGQSNVPLTEFDAERGVFDTSVNIDTRYKERFKDTYGQYEAQSSLDKMLVMLGADKLSPEQQKALRTALFQNSVSGESATAENLFKRPGLYNAGEIDKQIISGHLEEMMGKDRDAKKKLEFDQLHNRLRRNIGDPRAAMQDLLNSGQVERLIRIGLVKQSAESDALSLGLDDYMKDYYDAERRPASMRTARQVLESPVNLTPKAQGSFDYLTFSQTLQDYSEKKPIFVRLHADGFDDLRSLFNPIPPTPGGAGPQDGSTDSQSSQSNTKKNKTGKSGKSSVRASQDSQITMLDEHRAGYRPMTTANLSTIIRGRSSNDDYEQVMPERIKNVANAGWWAPPVDAIGSTRQIEQAQATYGTGVMMSVGGGSGGNIYSGAANSSANDTAQGVYTFPSRGVARDTTKSALRPVATNRPTQQVAKFSTVISGVPQAANDGPSGIGGGGEEPPEHPLFTLVKSIKDDLGSLVKTTSDVYQVMKTGFFMKVTRTNESMAGAVPLLKRLRSLKIADLDPQRIKDIYQKVKATRPAALVADSVQQMREELLIMQHMGIKAFTKDKLSGVQAAGSQKLEQTLSYLREHHPQALQMAQDAASKTKGKVVEIGAKAKQSADEGTQRVVAYLQEHHPELLEKAKSHKKLLKEKSEILKAKAVSGLEDTREKWHTVQDYMRENYPDLVDFIDPNQGSFQERKRLVSQLMQAVKSKTSDYVQGKIDNSDPQMAGAQFDGSLPGVASFIAYKVAELIGSGARTGANIFTWGLKRSAKNLGAIASVVKDLATRDTFDVYVEGDNKPRLTAAGIKAGLYFFSDNGEKLVNSRNINRPVRDIGNQEVISAQELTKLYVMDAKTRVLRLYNAAMGAVRPGVTMMKDAITKWYPRIWRAEVDMVKYAWNTLGKTKSMVKQALVDALDYPIDVYVVGSPTPALLARVMQAGGYVSATNHNKKILRPGDIDGAVLDVTGDKPVVALSIDDLKKGLIDANGEPIKGLSDKIRGLLAGIFRSGIDMAKWSWGVTKSVAGKIKNGIKGLFGELSIEINNKRSADTLGKIYEFLIVRFKSKRSKLGDKDGDGIVENSWQDYQAKKKAEQEKKAKEAKPAGIAKDKREDSKGLLGLLGGLGVLVKGVTDALGSFSSMFSMGLKLGGGLLKAGGMLGRGALAAGGFDLKALAATGSMGLSLLGGAARLGVGLLGGGLGMIGSAVAGTVSGVAAIGGGLLSLLSSPVVLAVGAVALAGYGAYKAYKHFTKDSMTKLQRMRYVQYGFAIEDVSHAHKVFALEDAVKKLVVLRGGSTFINERGLDVKELMTPFDLDPANEEHQALFFEWYQYRFKPVFLTHVVACHGMTKSSDLSKADDLKDGEFKKYVEATRFNSGPYNYSKLPVVPPKQATSKAYVSSFIDSLLKSAKDSKKESATPAAPVVAAGMVTSPGVRTEPKKDQVVNTSGQIKPVENAPADLAETDPMLAFKKDTSAIQADTSLRKAIAAPLALASASSVGLGLKAKVAGSGMSPGSTPQQVQALDAIRWKAYGLEQMEFDKVSLLMKLEQHIFEEMTFTSSQAVWEGDPSAVLMKFAGGFGVSLVKKEDVQNWTLWFVKRFLPIFTGYATAYKHETTRNDVLTGVKTLKPRQAYQIAKAISGEVSCWQISASPWVGYSLNTDANSVKSNMALLESMVKKDVLPQQVGVIDKPVAKKTSATGADESKLKSDEAATESFMGRVGSVVGKAVSAVAGFGKSVKDKAVATWQGAVDFTSDALGSISRFFETGGRGPGTISHSKGDYGGTSYGSYQLSTKTGTLKKFLDSSGYANQFSGLVPGSPEFDARWKELAADKRFAKAQDDFIKQTHYDPQMSKLKKEGIDLSGRGRAVQESVFSTATQFGPSTSVVKNAIGAKDIASMSDADVVSLVQDYKLSNNDTLFRSSSDAVRAGTANRAVQEKKQLLAMAQAQPGPKQASIAPAIPDKAASTVADPGAIEQPSRQPTMQMGGKALTAAMSAPGAEIDPKKGGGLAGGQGGTPAPKANIPSSATPTKTAPGPLLDGRNGFTALKIMPGVDINSINPAFIKKLYGMAEEYNQLTGKKFIVTSGYRSYQKQAELYKQLGPGKAAKPGASMHEYGLAMDLNRDELNEADRLGLMRKYGFTRPIGGEPWHMEHAATVGDSDALKRNPALARDLIEKGAGIGGGGLGTVSNAPLGAVNNAYATQLVRTGTGSQNNPKPAAAKPAEQAAGAPSQGVVATPAKPASVSLAPSPVPEAAPDSSAQPSAASQEASPSSLPTLRPNFWREQPVARQETQPAQQYVDRFGAQDSSQARPDSPAPSKATATQAMSAAAKIAGQGPMRAPSGYQSSQSYREAPTLPNRGVAAESLDKMSDTLVESLTTQKKLLEAVVRVEKLLEAKAAKVSENANSAQSAAPQQQTRPSQPATIKPRNVPVPMRSSFADT